MKKSLVKIMAVLMIFVLFTPSIAYGDQVHRVKPGEALYSIGAKYGVTINDIVQNNPFLKNPNILFLDQVLIIPEKSQTTSYRVQSGDTLYKISQKFSVSMSALASLNNLNNWNNLYIGQTLVISSDTSNSYTVKSGDTLYLISKKLGVSITELSKVNNLENVDYLYIGQILKVPNSSSTSNPQVDKFKALVAPYAEKYPETFYLKGVTNERRIALTFDDGPDINYTPQVLDILKANNVKATFFLVGSKVKEHPELVNRIITEGHTISNHTWTHPDLRKMTIEEIASEINQTEEAIRNATGLITAIMRPPFGAVNDNVIMQLQKENYKVIDWNIDSVDWSYGITPDEILMNTLPHIENDSIILMHDAYGDKSATVKVLPELIKTLTMNGYKFDTVDEMLNIPAYR